MQSLDFNKDNYLPMYGKVCEIIVENSALPLPFLTLLFLNGQLSPKILQYFPIPHIQPLPFKKYNLVHNTCNSNIVIDSPLPLLLTLTFPILLRISQLPATQNQIETKIANSKERTKKEIKKQKHDKNSKLPGFLYFTVI